MLAKSRVKYIQTLGQKKFRQQEGRFIAEGPKIVAELLTYRRPFVKEIFALQEWINENSSLIGPVACTAIREHELEKISQLSTPNQVLAVVDQFEIPSTIVTKNRITLALDGIRDPGNLGTILRIADWFGISQVICSPDSAEQYNPKVVQSSMGSITRVDVYYTGLEQWLASQQPVRIYAAVLDGQDISRMSKLNEGIILVGNEAKGIQPSLLELANVRITIPRKGKAESLNVAVATGIILAQLT